MHIVLVEDELAIRQALARALRRWGHQVSVATTIAEAEAAMHVADDGPQPDMVLSDGKLPDGHGLDFAIGSGLPFVMMSGLATFDDAVKAMRAGCVDFLTKPVKFDTLRTALDRVQAQLETQRQPALGETAAAVLLTGSASHRTWQVRDDAPYAAEVTSWDLSWQDQAQAAQAFADHEWPDSSTALVLSELMQATAASAVADRHRLIVNYVAGRWQALLLATIDWQANRVQQDRQQLLLARCQRCQFLPACCQLEWSDDADVVDVNRVAQ